MTVRLAIFISGGGSNMKALVNSMQGDHPARPAVIFSNDEHAGGILWARQQGIETAVIDHRPFAGDRAAFETAIQTRLSDYRPDMICLAGFMRVLTAGFVDPWKGRMINIHPSLLPKYRGLHTHARALAAGETEHGCTVHEVTPELDDGPILGQAIVPVKSDDTPDTLGARVLKREHELYPAVLRHFVVGDKAPVILR